MVKRTYRGTKQTNGTVLPQRCPLEVCKGDTARVRSETVADAVINTGAAVLPVEGRVASNGDRHKARKGAFVLDRHQKPLMPCSNKRARRLLESGRARIHKMHPFTIRLVDRLLENSEVQEVELKFDPGSKKTGVAIVRVEGETQSVLMLAEIAHRGASISDNLKTRAALRRHRRGNLRYRPTRFNNRPKPKGWLAPSLQHRVDNITSWVGRFIALVPVTGITMELVRFDMQQMENPEISGVEYQQGTLAGMECREYLLNKWDRKCAYCDAKNVPLQIEHIHPRARGGSNRINNLALACEPCNQAKGSQPIEAFLVAKPLVLARIKAQARRPFKDAAAVNVTRWALFNTLKATGLPVRCGSGGRTKWNRVRFGVEKTHALDAACVGTVRMLKDWNTTTLEIKATGRGRYGRTLPDKFGFPRSYLMRHKFVHGFKTGDFVKAVVPKGVNAGTFSGRVVVRDCGYFNVHSPTNKFTNVNHKNCSLVQRGAGYSIQVRHNSQSKLAPEA